jgi:multidrug efflux pump subunit AcrA (membrane-fusion protein)
MSEAESPSQVAGESDGSEPSQSTVSNNNGSDAKRSRGIGRGFVWGIGTGIAAGAIATFALLSDTSQSPQKQNVQASAVASENQTSSAVAVTTAVAQTKQVSRTLEATGTLKAREMLPVYPKATGLQIEQVLVDEGDTVNAGDVMVRLDNAVLRSRLEKARADLAQARAALEELQAGTRQEEIAQAKADVERYEAQLESAQSSLELANARVERNRQLANEGAIARDRLDEILTTASNRRAELAQAKAQLSRARERLEQLRNGPRREQIAQAQARVQSAKANVNQLEVELEQTIVRAPATGVVAERMAQVGDVTSSSNKLFSLIQDGLLELQVKVPETQLPQVEVGKTATITSDARESLQLQGRIHEIAPLVDAESRQATVKIHVPSRQGLRPGMFLRAEMATTTNSSVVVPAKAVLPQSDGKNMVFKLQPDNTVKAVSVEVGEILSSSTQLAESGASGKANGSSLQQASSTTQLEAGDTRVEILSGLQPGDRVVVEGAPYLANGDRVKPMKE